MEDTPMFPPARRPHRRHRAPHSVFKEEYLPALILLAAAVVILLLILGALSRP